MKITTARRRAVFIVFVAMAAFGSGGLVGSLTAEPEVVTRTVTHDIPPACSKAIDAARDERARTATAQEHDALARTRAADLADAALTLDAEVIEDAAVALDGELRLAQQADLEAAEAAARFDAAATKCLPEAARDR